MAESYPAYGDEAYSERPPRRRGRRLLVVLIVLLLLLAGLLVVADRLAAGFAERMVASQVSQAMAKKDVRSSAPQVTVSGFPFLTQVIDGRYESVTIVVRDLQGPVQGRAVTVPRLELAARDVTASIDALRSGQGDVRAETVRGIGTITYDSVAKLINQPGLTLAEQGGRLMVTAPLQVPIINQKITVRGAADLAVDKGQVVLRFQDLTADGISDIPVARAAILSYAKLISVRIPLPELPFALDLHEVRATPQGLVVTATARDVLLNEVT